MRTRYHLLAFFASGYSRLMLHVIGVSVSGGRGRLPRPLLRAACAAAILVNVVFRWWLFSLTETGQAWTGPAHSGVFLGEPVLAGAGTR